MLLCPARVATQVAADPSGEKRHNFAVLSSEPVAKRGAVGWNATDETQSLCPVRVATQVADELSDDSRHNFAVLSKLPVARRGAVGWNATE